MGPVDLAGRTYGPTRHELNPLQVTAYVKATGDDPTRWVEHAPPSFAGAALFWVAAPFLNDPAVRPHARLLIHGEQIFVWHRPWAIGDSLTVVGRVDRIRERAGTAFVTFVIEAHDDVGRPIMASRSLFLMGDTEAATSTPERSEPAAEARAANQQPDNKPLPEPGQSLRPLKKSASRLDLIRYASASGDFNAVHWDHQRGVESGVGGVICHGLLMAAWATQPATAAINRPDPLAQARFRFKQPLYPNQAARISTTVRDSTNLDAVVSSSAGDHVVARIGTRTA